MRRPDFDGQRPLVIPLYAQIRDRLFNRIVTAEWAAGDAIPNEFHLASHYRVSIGTIRRAVAALEERGVVQRVQGRGTFVAGRGGNALMERFERLRQAGGEPLKPDIELISVERIPASGEVAHHLGLQAGAEVHRVVQRLLRDGRVIGLWRSFLPADRLPSLEQLLRYGQHLYPVLEEYTILIGRTEDLSSAQLADAELRDALELPAQSCVITERRVAFALNDERIEYRFSAYVPGAVQVLHTSH